MMHEVDKIVVATKVVDEDHCLRDPIYGLRQTRCLPTVAG
jgi:hypothetical protein